MSRIIKLLPLALLATLAFSRSSKIAPGLEGLDANAPVDVIVQYRHAPTERHHALVRQNGGMLKNTLEVIRAGHYSIPAGALDALAADPEVVHIWPDRPVKSSLDVTAPTVNAEIGWKYGWTGKGIGIGIIDSGIADDPALHDPATGKTRVVYNQAFGVSGGTVDVYGHGTHVSGIAAGNGSDSSGKYVGIAPSADLINLRVLDNNGNGVDSNVIAAIQAAIQLKNTYNIRVINLSLGRPVYESYTQDPLCQAVEAAWKAGIVVVVAAGNDGRDNSAGTNGYGTITAPGNDPYVITVGAMKTMGTTSRGDDLIASYSSKGPTLLDHIVKPDLVAPGNRVISTLGKGGHTLSHNYPQNDVTGTYFKLSGTSMASAVVSGAAALVVQQNPSLTPDQVKARLMKTSTKNFPATSVATDPTTGVSYVSQYDIF
ncbi:MAG TPA: S8 family peptidase, partial [Bryobacteraceae bacterium]|nr:S8 family peptidase [Bryobacteraceae bacterium]